MFPKDFRDTDSFQPALQGLLWALRLAGRERQLTRQQEVERVMIGRGDTELACCSLGQGPWDGRTARLCVFCRPELSRQLQGILRNIYSGFLFTQLKTMTWKRERLDTREQLPGSSHLIKLIVQRALQERTNMLNRCYP